MYTVQKEQFNEYRKVLESVIATRTETNKDGGSITNKSVVAALTNLVEMLDAAEDSGLEQVIISEQEANFLADIIEGV